jgi:hypothetical protein
MIEFPLSKKSASPLEAAGDYPDKNRKSTRNRILTEKFSFLFLAAGRQDAALAIPAIEKK